MTILRQRMVEDVRVRNLSANTQCAYRHWVSAFAKQFDRSPAELGADEIRALQLPMIEVLRMSFSAGDCQNCIEIPVYGRAPHPVVVPSPGRRPRSGRTTATSYHTGAAHQRHTPVPATK
ncbi:hypothetical protein G3N95_15375 [Paraburkholderia sp. Tr-20389]|nr:hypothetical protein [Paraburkholderia sp. Tr-20389]